MNARSQSNRHVAGRRSPEEDVHGFRQDAPCRRLDLAPRELQPGDALHVKIVATDDSPWGQKGESRELLLKIPTMEERRAMARDAADSAVREAMSAAAAHSSCDRPDSL